MESRLDELEVRIAFQDDLLDALNRTVTRQQQELDLLQQQLRLLYQQIRQDPGEGAAGAPANDIPPHY
jgi:SlyX protein